VRVPPSLRPALRAVRPAALAAIALLAAPLVARPDPASDAAVRTVEGLHATLLSVMKDAVQLGYDGRFERLKPELLSRYDFAFMAEKSVGRGWQQFDAAAREKLSDAFARLAMATYAARFDGFGGERFETLGVQPATHDTVLVKTRIVRTDEPPVALDYRLRQTEPGQWRIVDVFLNGTVSELAMRRAEYSAVLKRDGYDGLIAALEEKIASQRQGQASGPAGGGS
jgi:phospholipid transport system substrate-binding protein